MRTVIMPKSLAIKEKPTLLSVALAVGCLLILSTNMSADNCNTNDCNDSCSNSSKLADCSSSDCGKNCTNDCFKHLKTSVHFRSQGANTARELVGWQWELNKPEMCDNYGSAYLAFEYQRSFKPNRIAEALFGSNRLFFAGSQVTDRSANELIADYFGLPTDFRGSILFQPRIENFIVDLGFYIGLDSWVQGMYLRFHAPLVHTRWSLDTNCGNCVNIQSGTTNPDGSPKQFSPCYMGNGRVNTAESIKQALSGFFRFGNMQTPWCAGLFDFARRTRTGLADIDVIVGYNWLNDDCYHFGTFIQAVLPTGKKAKDLYVFDPVVGNGKYFELGGGISAHTVLWSGEDSNFALFLEGNVTHLFRSNQCRLFDLVNNGPFSRYMLLKEFNTNGTTFSYANTLISATCFTNRSVDVSVGIKGDASLKLAYRWCGIGLDIGYNIYGHSREKIDLRCNACPAAIDQRRFGIKGIEGIGCFSYPIAIVNDTRTIFPAGTTFPAGATAPADCPALEDQSSAREMPNNSTQPLATAFNAPVPTAPVSASACTVCISRTIDTATPVEDLTPANNIFVNSGLQPTLLSVNDLDIHSAEALAVLTHKFFFHVCYTWMDECGWNPQLGVGGEVEVDGNHSRSACERSGLNQWGVWVKGCVSF